MCHRMPSLCSACQFASNVTLFHKGLVDAGGNPVERSKSAAKGPGEIDIRSHQARLVMSVLSNPVEQVTAQSILLVMSFDVMSY